MKTIALSPDGATGIVTYEVYWDPCHGYRAAYFSFEAEVANSSKLLLQQAIEQASKRRSVLDAIDFINDEMRVLGKLLMHLRILSRTPLSLVIIMIFLPEEGVYKLVLNITGLKNITVIVVHPWSNKVNVAVNGNSTVLKQDRVHCHEDRNLRGETKSAIINMS